MRSFREFRYRARRRIAQRWQPQQSSLSLRRLRQHMPRQTLPRSLRLGLASAKFADTQVHSTFFSEDA
jgi:hypothetical protein